MKDLLGQTLKGHYRVDAFIGRGGMADVYRAFDLRRSYPVAIKVMRGDLAEDMEFVNRFRREASNLSRLAHDNIVRFYEFAREGRMAFLVMDYVEGITLRLRILEAEGPMPLQEVRDLLHQICVALHYAHEEGIIHRDVKPGNIMLCPDGRVQVADFGIAKAMDSGTMTAVMPGTPAYMSPEQCRSQPVDRRTDVYALGIVAYEMLVGRRPFRGGSESSRGGTARERTRWEQMHAQPPPLRPLNPEIPPHIEAAIFHALAKDPADRPQTVLAFHHELTRDERKAPSAGVRPTRDVRSPAPPSQTGQGVSLEDTEATRLYDRAVEAMAQQDWDLAIQHLNALLAINPDYRDTIARLTEANRRKRIVNLLVQTQAALDREDWTEAIASSAEVIATDPRHTDARQLLHKARSGQQLERWYAEAVEALQAGDWVLAAALLEEIVTLEPTYRDTKVLLEQATLERERQFGTQRRATTLFEQAQAHAECREWTLAIEAATEALNLQPDTPAYREFLEQVQSELDLEVEYASACAALDREEWQEALDILPQVLARAPDYRHANELLEQARKGERAARAREIWIADLIAQAHACEETENWQRAAELYSEAYAAAPERSELEGLLAAAQDAWEKQQAAILKQEQLAAERAARVKEIRLNDLMVQAHALGGVGNWQHAVRLYSEAHALAPERSELEELLTAAQEELEKQRAEEKAARARETWIADLMTQAQAFGEMGNWQQAVQLYDQAHALAPDRKELEELLVAARAECEKQQEAVS